MSKLTRYFREITARDKSENGVVSLAIRPNMPSQYGEGSLSGKQLQQRFDRLAGLIIERYNTMASALSSNEVLEYFKLPEEYSFSHLLQLIERISDTSGNILIDNPDGEGRVAVKDILNNLYVLTNAVAAFLVLDEHEEGKTIQDIYATIADLKAHEEDETSHPAIFDKVEKAILTHNKSSESHEDLRKAISAGDTEQSTALSKHDKSDFAHSNLFSNISTKIAEDVSTHSKSAEAHTDIRSTVKIVSDALTALEGVVNEFLTGAEDNDGTLDRLKEIVAYIESNKGLIDTLRDDKVDKTDIATSLTVDDETKVLAASVGKIILKMFEDYVKRTEIEDIVNANYVSESELKDSLEAHLPSDLRSTLYEVFKTNGSFGLEYQLNLDGENIGACIGIGDCPYTDIAVASEVNGVPITLIAYGAFKGLPVTSVEVLTGNHAFLSETFKDCTELKTVNIHGGIINLVYADFSGCFALESIRLPKSVTIGESCFYGCSGLKDVYYEGTMSEWRSLSIESVGNEYLINATIHCSDGTINGTGG